MNDTAESTDLQKEVRFLKERLDQSATELQDFLYIVSHDFRGPLRAIMSSSMILLEDHGDSLNKEAKEELKRQSEAARKLNRLLEELLKLSRLNRQELILENYDLGALAQQVADSIGLEPSALTLQGDLQANMDQTLASLLIEALVDNGAKFVSPERSLRLEFGRDDSGFYFRDNGIGIDPERKERIFLPFERLNGDDYKGLGMGLATAKRIVNRHLGSISAHPNPDGGTTIRFTVLT